MQKKTPKIAVILFPGTNCELETVAALKRNGFAPEVLRWNEKKSLKNFAGVVIPGGFSYEDRGRSGLIASRDPMMQEIFAIAKRGGVVLGICNGAQVLVESGIVPNFEFGKSPLALTYNRRVKNGKVMGSGFYNAWVNLKANTARVNAFNQFPEDTILKVPVAHGEGRFYTEDPKLIEQLVANGQNAFLYVTPEGELDSTFPTNPNASILNLAGVTNPAGNVMALMPHPERCAEGDVIFQSMYLWITGKVKKPKAPKFVVKLPVSKILPKPKMNVELFVSLIITDNEALSVGAASKLNLTKYRYFGLDFAGDEAALEKIIRSGDLLNPEKEAVIAKINGKTLRFDKKKGWLPSDFTLPANKALAVLRDTSGDAAKAKSLPEVKMLRSGMLWVSSDAKKTDFEKAVKGGFFHHPAASDLMAI
ncbi:MAG: phosphoribosylformylglycinamidine synthase I [Candidatus Gracilibacteria bacterium]|nr:phosphoribosylformylglycinamidine synthase I [Candidatus Gracilibacteria bacterium]MDD5179102.1 phosphoribosylformylglycinamidine synthase I [Candidatus Gracilibacteria bacterium]